MIAKLHSQMVALAAESSAGATPGMVAYGMAAAVAVTVFLTFPPLVALYRNAYGNEQVRRVVSMRVLISTLNAI